MYFLQILPDVECCALHEGALGGAIPLVGIMEVHIHHHNSPVLGIQGSLSNWIRVVWRILTDGNSLEEGRMCLRLSHKGSVWVRDSPGWGVLDVFSLLKFCLGLIYSPYSTPVWWRVVMVPPHGLRKSQCPRPSSPEGPSKLFVLSLHPHVPWFHPVLWEAGGQMIWVWGAVETWLPLLWPPIYRQELNLLFCFSKMKVNANSSYFRVVGGFTFFFPVKYLPQFLTWMNSQQMVLLLFPSFAPAFQMLALWSSLPFPSPWSVISPYSEALLSRASIAPYFMCFLPWWILSPLGTLFHKPLFPPKDTTRSSHGSEHYCFWPKLLQNWQSLGLQNTT